MNRNRLFLIGVAALVIAGAITYVAYQTFIVKMAAVKRRTGSVVMATKDLGMAAKIEPGDVRLVDMPAADLPEGTFDDLNKVIGRGVITPLAKNELILQSKLAGPGSGAGLPAIIPENMRAVSVQVNDVISVAGFVTPGTRVDVLLTGTPNNNPSSPDVLTTTVLENVEVLAAGEKLQPSAQGKPEKVPVITLLVSPVDAQKLTLASQQGKIQLSLRNPMDAKKQNVDPVRNASLYRQPAAPVAVKAARHVAAAAKPAPLPVYSVEVIKGHERSTSSF